MKKNIKQIIKKIMILLLVITVSGSVVMWNETPIYASMADEAIEYTMGETYRGGYGATYYYFTLDQKSHVSLDVKSSVCHSTYFTIYDANGKKYLIPGNVAYTENVVSGIQTGRAARMLKAGTYYLEIYDSSFGGEYYFSLQAEAPIILAKGSIKSLKSSKSGQMTVSCQNVNNALGYRIQYSTDYRFKKGVKTVYSPTEVKMLTKLSRGKRYYVKVTPYTVYSDGSYAWGGTSYVKVAVVK